jgi:hypothetical protein
VRRAVRTAGYLRKGAIAAVSIAFGCAPVAKDVPFLSPGPGTSKEQAIEVCEPAGERAYLAQLRCPDGRSPSFARVGSFGMRYHAPPGAPAISLMDSLNDPQRRLQPGEIDQHIIDGYRVVCGRDAYLVFLDMYHCGDLPPVIAPPGFSFGNSRSAPR